MLILKLYLCERLHFLLLLPLNVATGCRTVTLGIVLWNAPANSLALVAIMLIKSQI